MLPAAQFDVFISHNSADKPWATQLKTAVEHRGLKVWLDKDEIRPGDLFAKSLEDGIRNSSTVALVVSPEAVSSVWVEEEYYRALSLATNNGKTLRLIPVLLRSAELPGFLSSRQWVDFRDPTSFDSSVDQLYWGITGKRYAGIAKDAPRCAVPNKRQEMRPLASSRKRSTTLLIIGAAALFTFLLRVFFANFNATRGAPLDISESLTLFGALLSLFWVSHWCWSRLRRRQP
jgi:hypothetical protein